LYRCGSPCCGVHGHIADSVRLGGAVRWTVSFHGRPRTGAAGARSALTCVAESSLHSPCARPCPCDVPGAGGQGRGGGLVRESVTLAGWRGGCGSPVPSWTAWSAGDVAVLLASFSATVCGIAARVFPGRR
jgi:hypothetical protein